MCEYIWERVLIKEVVPLSYSFNRNCLLWIGAITPSDIEAGYFPFMEIVLNRTLMYCAREVLGPSTFRSLNIFVPAISAL